METQQEEALVHLTLTQIVNKMKDTTLMFYDLKENGNTIFYFNGLPILETLSEIPKSYRFKELGFMASNNQDYIFADDIQKRNGVEDLVRYFTLNSQYSLDNLDAVFYNDIKLSIHDDTELTLTFPKNFNYNRLIKKILTGYKYSFQSVITHLKTNRNKYLTIKRPDNVIKIYHDFKEYWNEKD